MKRFLEIGLAVAVAAAITVSWERWDREAEVAEQVGAELAALELYVDTLRPNWEAARRLGNTAKALCADRVAASQVVRVQQEEREKGGEIEPVCGQ